MKSIEEILIQNDTIHFKYIKKEKKIICSHRTESPSQIKELVNIIEDLKVNNIEHTVIDISEIIIK